MNTLLLLIQLGLATIILTILVETKNSRFGAFFIAFCALAYNYFYDQSFLSNAWKYILDHPANIAMYVVGWLTIGVIWSFYRWYIFLLENKKEQDDYNRARSILNPNYSIPTASSQKGLIVSWMIFWIISMIGYLFQNPIAKLYNFIFDQVHGIYNKITVKVFSQP